MHGSSVAKSYRENFRFHDYMRITADARKQAEIRSKEVRTDGDDHVRQMGRKIRIQYCD